MIADKYLFLFLYDEYQSIDEGMADRIYASIPNNNTKPILLILHSRGGSIEPAYLISKTCRENSQEFSVAVPRRAKSAATLISLGAKSIHMGHMSELGPIDPQFGRLPALGLSSSLERIAKIVTAYPKSSDMFARYLSEKLELPLFGYFERVSESAEQYAKILLEDKNTLNINDVANRLVYGYKDHSFVIDKDEAKKYLNEMIKTNTDEYRLANTIHKFMSKLNIIFGIEKKIRFSIIGQSKNFISNKIEE